MNRFEDDVTAPLTFLDYFSMYERITPRNADKVDGVGQGWKRLAIRRVRVYPFYKPGNGDLYYAQPILTHTVYRSALQLLESIEYYGEYCIANLTHITSSNGRVQ